MILKNQLKPDEASDERVTRQFLSELYILTTKTELENYSTIEVPLKKLRMNFVELIITFVFE